MPMIFNSSPTTAQTLAVSSVWQFGANAPYIRPRSLLLQGSFAYGSGGSTVDCWIQSSIDGTSVWWDVANFHFTQANKLRGFNLSSLTPVTTSTTPSFGTLANDTALDGFLGNYLRVLMTTTGTYAASQLWINALGDIKLTKL